MFSLFLLCSRLHVVKCFVSYHNMNVVADVTVGLTDWYWLSV